MPRKVQKKYFLALLFPVLAGVGPGFAQDDPAADGQLADQFEANIYYAGQARLIWRRNAEELTAIDEAYRNALAALSAENVRRIQAIVTENAAAHKSLTEKELQGDEHGAEFSRIQANSNKARTELMAWYESEARVIREEHSSKRAAQMAATTALIEQLGEQRVATLQRLLSAPVNLDNLPALTFPDSETATGSVAVDPGDAISSGGAGIDLGGTVDIDRQENPAPGPLNPELEVPPERPLQAHVDAVGAADVNTRVAPNDFDIAMYAIEKFKFEGLELKNGTLRGDPLRVTLIVANRGARTYAFANNELVVEIVEGIHDFSGGDVVVSSNRPQKTRAVMELVIPAEHGIQVDVPVFRKDDRSAFKKLGDALKVGLSGGIKSAEFYSGSMPVRIKPNIWYTVDVRLTTPREYDNVTENHGAYLHIRFDDQGSAIERDGPFFFEPPSTVTAEDKF